MNEKVAIALPEMIEAREMAGPHFEIERMAVATKNAVGFTLNRLLSHRAGSARSPAVAGRTRGFRALAARTWTQDDTRFSHKESPVHTNRRAARDARPATVWPATP